MILNADEGPLVSIIMTTRNAEKFLQATLDSIISQSYRHWELIVVNNQSTDKTFAILNNYATKDARIKVFTNPGVPEIIPGLQYGFSQSSGSFITRMDSDDLMTPNKLKILVNLLLENGPGHVVTGCVRHFSDEKVLQGFRRYDAWINRVMRSGSHYREIYRECVIPSSCWMVHRQDFMQCGAFGQMVYPEDYNLCFRFYSGNMKIVASNEVLHLWREHTGRISKTDDRYKDQLYYDLKLSFFVKLDLDKNANLIVWGAGKKGKKLATKLQRMGLSFGWVCNNEKKIGHNIYGTLINHPELLIKPGARQVLVAVSAREKDDIDDFLLRHQIWHRWFC
ncbi:glycosyltransferase family 2 protein [Fulvivirgaceae bacterium BMA12]|uniref:Glycosyltransferase family 2 protein n=1 Tax=Agaribacillus aureus TaxID=3051825 RepID=A0ABT8LB38_9BACT|nr:glycosyltransferase family 2 protein [Fulvivirgaceae bacterium BMA12]